MLITFETAQKKQKKNTGNETLTQGQCALVESFTNPKDYVAQFELYQQLRHQ